MLQFTIISQGAMVCIVANQEANINHNREHQLYLCVNIPMAGSKVIASTTTKNGYFPIMIKMIQICNCSLCDSHESKRSYRRVPDREV